MFVGNMIYINCFISENTGRTISIIVAVCCSIMGLFIGVLVGLVLACKIRHKRCRKTQSPPTFPADYDYPVITFTPELELNENEAYGCVK